MLIELSVQNLGIVEDLSLVFDAGLTAFTGETGAGKTMIVEAIGLLTGARADPNRVRQGASQAKVEGRFDVDGEEVVLTRIVPASGRSRGYVNGDMATVSNLAAWGDRLVAQHGQHEHQTLSAMAAQRDALDTFARIDLGPLHNLRDQLAMLRARQRELGGDAATRERELELLRYQVDELDAAALTNASEDDDLAIEQARLADVEGDREHSGRALALLTDEKSTLASLSDAIGELEGRERFHEFEVQLRSLYEQLSDATRDFRHSTDEIVEDPERLDAIRERRQLLATLGRKYGDGSVGGLIDAHRALQARVQELEEHDVQAARIAREIAASEAALEVERTRVHGERVAAAPKLAAQIQSELRKLAMPHARVAFDVTDSDEVQLLLAANPGTALMPLAKVASGGELARMLLAVRLVLTQAPHVMVFDEVDAGIGGSAATAVGAALERLGRDHQVFVVTHLPQVAAAANIQFGVTKVQADDATTTTARRLTGDDRVVELSRMLSGQPESETARLHARELLELHHKGGERA